VVGREPQLVGRRELERLAVEAARGDAVAAGELLDERLVDTAAFAGLDSGDEAGAGEPCEVWGRAAAGARLLHEHLGRRLLGVVAEELLEGVYERRLAVLAAAVKHEEHLLLG